MASGFDVDVTRRELIEASAILAVIGGLPGVALARESAPTPDAGAALRAEIGEARGEQGEVLGLLGGDRDPVVVERARQALVGEARDDVPGEVDGVELDVGEGVVERLASRQRFADPAPRHLPRWPQLGGRGPRRTRRRFGRADRGDLAPRPGRREAPAQPDLAARIGGPQHRNRRFGETRTI